MCEWVGLCMGGISVGCERGCEFVVSVCGVCGVSVRCESVWEVNVCKCMVCVVCVGCQYV